MSKAVQRRRGTTAEHTTFTGALGELTVDTTKDTIVVHDGAAAGGYPLLREDGSNSALAIGSAGTPSLKFTGDPDTGLYSPGADQVAISTGGTGRLFIDASGNIGINVAIPTRQIDIATSNTAAGLGYTIRLRANATAAASAIQWTTSDASQTNGYIACNTARDMYFASGSTERMRIDSSGRLLVGTSSSRSIGGAERNVQIEGTSGSNTHLTITRNSNDAGAPLIGFLKTRGATNGAVTTVADSDELGTLRFYATDGTSVIQGAQISAFVDGTPGANDMPGRLVFSTTADGAASPTERLRITSAGVLQIADAGNITVGTTTGTKIGTATTQKLGFYNKTPVVQPAAVADATDAASVITQLNALLARMRDLGLIAT